MEPECRSYTCESIHVWRGFIGRFHVRLVLRLECNGDSDSGQFTGLPMPCTWPGWEVGVLFTFQTFIALKNIMACSLGEDTMLSSPLNYRVTLCSLQASLGSQSWQGFLCWSLRPPPPPSAPSTYLWRPQGLPSGGRPHHVGAPLTGSLLSAPAGLWET